MEISGKLYDGRKLNAATTYSFDLAIVGAGAAGGLIAEMYAKAGLNVALIEEGPFQTSKDFKMRESDAYPHLYQESGARTTADKSIRILQGRGVGGGTTVNWTTSFRTPDKTLKLWQNEFGLKELTNEKLRPWFERVEKQYNISSWDVSPNSNNQILEKGLKKLGLPFGVIKRNVLDCANLGYCGLGCPVDAKQSTLVKNIPGFLKNNGQLFFYTKVERVLYRRNKAIGLLCRGAKSNGIGYQDQAFKIQFNTLVMAAGAIGTPALMLRSLFPDPQKLIGKRTFIHPVSVSASVFDQDVNAYEGAPQVIYSDHFQKQDSGSGFKLEVPPVYPVILASFLGRHGQQHLDLMKLYPKTQVIISLQTDGQHPESQGGVVTLNSKGLPVLDYQLSDYLKRGVRNSYLAMAEIQFAAGARRVIPMHRQANQYQNWQQAKQHIGTISMEQDQCQLISAHVMGGCAMGSDSRKSVVDPSGRFRYLENVYVFDGSLFPTSIGANPMESIFAISSMLGASLLEKLKE